jgi:hypothetical protein
MFKIITRRADGEIRSVIGFLNSRNVKAVDIRQICKIYGENAWSDGMVRKCVRKFNEGRDSMYDKPQSGRLSLVGGVFTGTTFYEKGIKKLAPRYNTVVENM